MKLLKEIADFYRFFRKISEEKRQIVFYAEHGGYYPNFEGIINELTESQQQTICYITSDSNDTILQNSNPRIETFYLKNLLALFMIVVNCKVFVMTLTDLHRFHLKRSINPVHYVYVFHSLVSMHMMYRHGAFDHYDSILCVGKHQVKEFHKYGELEKTPLPNLIEAGYYRLERIYCQYQKYLTEKADVSKKTTVLVAPSWGDKNILESCGEYLVNLLLESGYKVIVRPHPETVRRNPKLLDTLAAKFGDNIDFTQEMSVATDDSLLTSDILICDCSGVALEYAFGTERPVLFLNVPYKIKNDRFKELEIEPIELSVRTKIGLVLSPEKIDEVPQCIKKLLTEQEKYREDILQLRNQSVYAFGRSSEIGAEHIVNLTQN
ncbi:MAG: hypothetical protein FVQ80_00560 [Planctomycetes bacterium]|nr:hypothetical protein [Planctomycetota bacterium]